MPFFRPAVYVPRLHLGLDRGKNSRNAPRITASRREEPPPFALEMPAPSLLLRPRRVARGSKGTMKQWIPTPHPPPSLWRLLAHPAGQRAKTSRGPICLSLVLSPGSMLQGQAGETRGKRHGKLAPPPACPAPCCGRLAQALTQALSRRDIRIQEKTRWDALDTSCSTLELKLYSNLLNSPAVKYSLSPCANKEAEARFSYIIGPGAHGKSEWGPEPGLCGFESCALSPRPRPGKLREEGRDAWERGARALHPAQALAVWGTPKSQSVIHAQFHHL